MKNRLAIIGVIGVIVILIGLLGIYPRYLMGGKAKVYEYIPSMTCDNNFKVVMLGKNLNGKVYINGHCQDQSIIDEQQSNRIILNLQRNNSYDGNDIVIEVKNAGLFRLKSNKVNINIINGNSDLKFNTISNKEQIDVLEVNADDFREYLKAYLKCLSNTPYRIYMSIKDEGSQYMDDDLQQCLYTLGAKKSLQNQFRASYLGIFENGNNIYEALSREQPLLYKDNNVNMFSGGYAVGNYSSINIQGRETSLNQTGLNIVVYDADTNKILDSVTFDLCYGNKIIRKANFKLEFLQEIKNSYL